METAKRRILAVLSSVAGIRDKVRLCRKGMKMCQAHDPAGVVSRRGFVRLAGLGLGAAVVTGFRPDPAQANGMARALMLSCMDYRLVDDLVNFMAAHDYHDNYDHIALAGASLAVVNDAFAEWHQVFWDHVQLAKDLHGITEVIVIDHRDCGAYRLALSEAAVDTAEKETAAHRDALQEFARQMAERHPELQVYGVLMGLDGVGENIMAGGASTG
jgi:LmbE family N-acetylglucosaminyl deacetylase